MSRPEHTIDNMKISTLHSLHHASEQIRPLIRKVLHTDQANGVTELSLYLLGTGEHQLDDSRLDRLAVVGRDLVSKVSLFGQLPVAFDEVLEGD